MEHIFNHILQNPRFWRIFAILSVIGYFVYLILNSISDILSPFIIGFGGAYLFSGMIKKLEFYKIPRIFSSAFIVLTFLIALAIIGMIAIPFLQKELVILAKSLPALAKEIYTLFEWVTYTLNTTKVGDFDLSALNIHLNQSITFVAQWVINFAANAIGNNGKILANMVTSIFLTPLIMFYFLKDWPRLLESLDRLLPLSKANTIRFLVKRIHFTLSTYVRSQGIICIVLMILYSLGLSIVGLRQAIFIGILTGFLAFIPYVGMLIGLILSLTIAFEQFQDWYSILKVGGIFMMIHLVESNLITPYFIGEKIGVHPLWILFSLLTGWLWFGFTGILLAVPMVAVIGTCIRTSLELCSLKKPFNYNR